jgi:hypothetical protein
MLLPTKINVGGVDNYNNDEGSAAQGGASWGFPVVSSPHPQQRDCPIFLKSKKKMTQKQNQPQNSTSIKEINHTSH